MNAHKNARLTPFSRELMIERIRNQGWTVARAAEAAGVSERTAYKWLARYRGGGTAALHNARPVPRRLRHRLPQSQIALIEGLRRQRLSGPAIAGRLGLPRSTVGAILRRCGLGRLRNLEERVPVRRYERKSPGELIHLDTKKLGQIVRVGRARAKPAAAQAGRRCTSPSTMQQGSPIPRCCPMRRKRPRSLSSPGPWHSSPPTASALSAS